MNQANFFKELIAPLNCLSFLAVGVLAAQYGTQDIGRRATVPPDHDILQDGHVLEQADILKSPGQPHGCHAIWLKTIDLKSFMFRWVHQNFTPGRLVNSGHTVEERCLPCSIRANQGHDFPGTHL